MTTSAPLNTRVRVSAASGSLMSALTQSAHEYGATGGGLRRLSPTSWCSPLRPSLSSSAVPTLPDAPVITIRTEVVLPKEWSRCDYSVKLQRSGRLAAPGAVHGCVSLD